MIYKIDMILGEGLKGGGWKGFPYFFLGVEWFEEGGSGVCMGA